MNRFLKKFLKDENGQSTVILAIMLVAIMGGAALAIDMGNMYLTKIELQNAADNAALAGALSLPNTYAGTADAYRYAYYNGVDHWHTDVETPYEGDDLKIEVTCRKKVKMAFAKVLGINDTEIRASSVAIQEPPIWCGEAFPFVNLDDDYSVDSHITVWEDTGPGNFESLWKTEYTAINLGAGDDHSQGYFSIDYSDGLTVTKGEVATIKQEIGYIYDQHRPGYVFSLSSDVINSGKYNSIKNQDVIALEDLVLLQVTFDRYNSSEKHLYLTVLNVYDFNNGELPTEYLNDDSTLSSRIAG